MKKYLYYFVIVLLIWGILYAELGETVGLQGELLSMTLLVISAYLIGWLWMKITTLPALIGMLLTGILFQNLKLVHMTDDYKRLNQDLRWVIFLLYSFKALYSFNFFSWLACLMVSNRTKKIFYRKIALVIILTRAGLGLDAGVLKKHYAAVLQLGLIPWSIECILIAVSTFFLLHLPWSWG